jgi:hypothetical protein
MKSRNTLLAVALGLALLLSFTLSAPSQSPANAGRQQWEHLAMTVDASDGPGDAEASRKIMQLGGEGWELVDVEALSKDGTTTKLIYFFKRPK